MTKLNDNHSLKFIHPNWSKVKRPWRTSGEEINGIYRKNKDIENMKSNGKEQERHEDIKTEGENEAWKDTVTERIGTEFL